MGAHHTPSLRRFAWLASCLVWLVMARPAWAGPPADTSEDLPSDEAVAKGDRSDLDLARGPAGPGADDAGQRAVEIVEVEIVGREQVSRRQILGIMGREGLEAGREVFVPDDARVARARSSLVATGYFRSVNITLEPDGPSAAVLVVTLEERSSLHFTKVYLGSSRFTPFRGGIEVEEQNFLGRAVNLGGGIIWGSVPSAVSRARRQQGYKVSVESRSIAGSKFGINGRAYFLSAAEPYRVAGALDDPDPKNFQLLDYDRIGGVVGGSYSINREWTIGADYRFERVSTTLPEDPIRLTEGGRVRPVRLDLEDGETLLTTLDFSVRWDGRDLLRKAGVGGRFAFDVQIASPALGSTYEYVRLALGAGYAFRLPWGHFVTPSFVAGQIVGSAPRFERFYAGDLSDLVPGREFGLTYSTRGPFDILGTGIDTQVLGNIFARGDLEYAIALFRSPRTRFVEGGQFFASAGIFVLSGDRAQRDLRRSDGLAVAPIGFNANIGVRLVTSMGTLDLSVGNVLRRLPL